MWHKAIWKGHPMRLELTRVGLLKSSCEWITTRSRRRVSNCLPFLTRRDWKGSDLRVCRFSLATSSLKLNSSSILTFSGVYCAVLHARWIFYCRIAYRNNNFGRVAWESKYDAGRPETCKDPKNITDPAHSLGVWLQLQCLSRLG